MATIPLPPESKELLRLFENHGVEYLLVGGHAVIHHGYVRSTGDTDLWIAVSPVNASRVSAALREFAFSADSVPPELFVEEGPMIRMGVAPFRIEILTSISGVNFADAFSRRIRESLGEFDINVITLEDPIANKKASGRLKDLADIENLIPRASKKSKRRGPSEK